MLCVTPVVSSQMSSPLAIQFLFHKEISAGKSGEIIWRAKTLVVVGTNYKPKSNISVLMHCWSLFGNMVSTHTSCSKTTECNVVEIGFQCSTCQNLKVKLQGSGKGTFSFRGVFNAALKRWVSRLHDWWEQTGRGLLRAWSGGLVNQSAQSLLFLWGTAISQQLLCSHWAQLCSLAAPLPERAEIQWIPITIN